MQTEFEETNFQEHLATKIQNFCSCEGIDEKDVNEFFMPEISMICQSIVESKDIERIMKELKLEEQRVANRKSVLMDCFFQNYPDMLKNDESIIKEGVQFSWRSDKIVVNFYIDLLCAIENPFAILNYLFKALIPLNPKSSQEVKDFFTSARDRSEIYGNISAKFVARNFGNREIVFMFHHSNLYKSDNDKKNGIGCVYPDSFSTSYSKKDDENNVAVSSAASIFDTTESDQRYDAALATTRNNASSSMWKNHMNVASGMPLSNKRSNETFFSSSFNRTYGNDNGNRSNDDLRERGYSSPSPSLRDYGKKFRYEDTEDGDDDDDNDDNDSGDEDGEYGINDEEDDRRYWMAKNSDSSGSDRDQGINYCLARNGKALLIIPKGGYFCRAAFFMHYVYNHYTKFLSGYNINKLKAAVEKLANDLAKIIKIPTSSDDECVLEQMILEILKSNKNVKSLGDLIDSKQRENKIMKFLWKYITCRKEINMIGYLNLCVNMVFGNFYYESPRNITTNSKIMVLPVLPKFQLFKFNKIGSLKIRAYCNDAKCVDRCVTGAHKSHEIRTITPVDRQPLASRDLLTNMKVYRLPAKYSNCFYRTAFHNFFCHRFTFSGNKDSKDFKPMRELIYLIDFSDVKAYKYKLNKNGKKVHRKILSEDVENGDLFIQKSRDEIFEHIQERRLTPRDGPNLFFRCLQGMINFWNTSEKEREYFEKEISPFAKIFFTNADEVSKVHNIVKKQNSFRVHRILSGLYNVESISGFLGGFNVVVKNNEVTIFSSNAFVNVLNANVSVPLPEIDDSTSDSFCNLMPEISLNAKLIAAECAESRKVAAQLNDEEKERAEYFSRDRQEEKDKNIEKIDKRKYEANHVDNKRRKLAKEKLKETEKEDEEEKERKEEKEEEEEEQGEKIEGKEDEEEGEGENSTTTDIDSLEGSLPEIVEPDLVLNENFEMF